MPAQAASQRATIRLVAERACCAVSTVSRVINQSGPSSAAVRERVEAAITELGFKPSALGQNFRLQRTRTVGVVVPSFTNPVFAGSVSGIETEARDAGRNVLIAVTDYDPAREEEAVDTLLRQKVDGLIVTVADCDNSPALDLLDREGVPYVLVYNQPIVSERSAVTVDNFAATFELTQRCIALGHRHIGFIAGRFRSSDRSRLRFEGCKAALSDADLPPPALLELDYLATTDEHRAHLAAQLDRMGRPTALLCSNDLLALSIISALRELGLDVPDDVSVAGFDGITIGRMVAPSLATIDTPTRMMGKRAMARLQRLISGEEATPRVDFLPHTFRPGASLSKRMAENER